MGVKRPLLVIGCLAVVAMLWLAVATDDPRPPGTTTPPTAATLPAALPKVPWEGGPAYYARFPATKAAGWTADSFFPIGVWYESVISQDDVDKDKAAGVNTYVELTETSDMALIRKNGMFAIPSKPITGYGAETVAWLITDEADMWAGPGDDGWTGNFPGQGPLCVPDDPDKERCGYTVMKTLKGRLPSGDGRPYYANYGKGVMVHQSDKDAARFVNDYTDLVSLDLYWYTSSYACQDAENWLDIPPAQCRLAANYGSLIDRQRELDAVDGRRQPVYAFVEVGWPAPEDKQNIEPDQLKGAVMSSLIHEARGIIYFNHSFGGPCQTQHALRDKCGERTRPAVTEMDRQIRQLAPVLNTQSLRHPFGPGLDTMLKAYKGSYYVFSMLKRGEHTGPRTFTLPGGVTPREVEVLYENRRLPVSGGTFTDSFEKEYSYHIYKVTP
jgi:hypothetical protein